ncbi:4-diphosphocytidyl-2C-methyl-D-erythritol kinase [Anaeromyxobacter dehalogenans 2CP-1]|uniref:4-diphosphocytidyl-2-C-methyl-D-erythritol kinase n=1 Tax=Anaeromyxobacter dehalogenans (strain ATCC BAA-258 / DSM 21875 / 2CP-1) TaxID=455488 RepID=ISPE_ANAD2|nr:4-(cytidine 5'-diphospho)-2-C-methyl-D-erythritol kinase [Anaeromyxobacter dehalogenans]B8J808.1 RecName: Full=4-diphosphocytidyl-2-C-methyl-D-erythritol kinase; Short=CMK; AltName: Full=4-(cytidine-5'-diphospho)-2-C-methyl-D-erythritol kinase [Anaeromyxobacter dehalogenans 2CP-1]ACL63500.1 4-diphosphocytidyl-2C-methyl-D-erythritol kinase [Anaeromyxobacter dehalogenans 2CP-1]
MRLVTLAPAKVNLVLRVGPVRADGYHDLRTLMVPLDLGDRVDVRVSPRRGPVRCTVPGRPELDGPENLAARAAEAFRRRFGVDRAVSIRIEKRTPVTAGLGGGSSDAAAVLRCLARALRVRDGAALAALALEIGSDVPFFLGPGPAWAAGRGERLSRAEVPPLDLVLVYPADPSLAIRAGDAYRWLDEARASGSQAPRRLGRPGRWRPTLLGNDLQAPCVARKPALQALLGLLVGAGATAAIMSGSGPTVFGIFPGRGAARGAALAIQGRAKGGAAGVQVLLARTVRRHPRVSPWRSPRSASSRSTRRSSRPT